jgi:hypothetical protein
MSDIQNSEERPAVSDQEVIEAYMARYKEIFTVVKDGFVELTNVMTVGSDLDKISEIAHRMTEKLLVL